MASVARKSLWLLLLAPLALLTANTPPGKAPPPEAALQTKARAIIRSIFKADYAKAETDAAARRKLADTLLQEGKRIRDDMVLRFTTLQEAYDLSVRANDLATALEAVAELSSAYAVETLHLRANAVLRLDSTTRSATEARAFARIALTVTGQAFDADDLDIAQQLLASAETAARQSENPALAVRVQQDRKHLEWRLKEFERIRPAQEELRKNPKHLEANLIAGKYRCLVLGKWEEGLPLLASGADEKWRTLAALDLSHPSDRGQRVALADGWRDLAQSESGMPREQLLRRAYDWYRQALDGLEDQSQQRVRQRLDAILDEVPYLVVGEIRRLREAGKAVPAVAVSPDGRYVYCAGWDHRIKQIEIRTGKEIGVFEGHTEEVWAVAVSLDGAKVLSGGKDHTVRLWDASTRKELQRLEGHADQVRSVAFAPDGHQAASGGEDRTVRLWDLQTGKQAHVWEGHGRSVESVVFSPGGKRLLSASWDRTVRVWDVAERKELRRLRGHADGIYRVVFAPDGRHALTASADRTQRWWDVETGEELRRFVGHTGHVIAAALSPDGLLALSGGGDGDPTVRLWDVETGKELQRFSGHRQGVWSVAFLPHGWRAVSSGEDGMVQLWGLPR